MLKTIRTLALLLVALAVAMPAGAQPTRLYDKEVKSLIEQSKQTFDHFWDALDGQLKNSTFKGPSGEFVVKRIGEDYKTAIDLANSRFNDTYSAGTEVGAFLKDAVRFQNYVEKQGASMKGASEWQAHTSVLGKLAVEYGATFPPTEGQTLRRYSDKEVVDATRAIEQSSAQLASTLENALKKDKATPEAARKATVADVKRVGEAAKVLESTVKDGKPASALVTSLFDQAKKGQAALTASGAASAVQGQWVGIDGKLATIAAAYHQK